MIFLDRSIPKSVAEALKKVRNGDIRWLEDDFKHDEKDEVWIPEIGKREWLAVMRDKKIRTRLWQRELVKRYDVGCFILQQKHDPTRWEYLKLFAGCLDEMERLYSVTPRPFMFLIDSNRNFRQFF